MNSNTVFSATLVSSLVLWFPSMQACLRGDLDLVPAALRYLTALLISRLALNGIARLVNAYRATQEPASPADQASAAPPVGQPPAKRRRGDDGGDGESDPSSATLAA
jgi:hypothetical protein